MFLAFFDHVPKQLFIYFKVTCVAATKYGNVKLSLMIQDSIVDTVESRFKKDCDFLEHKLFD